MVKTGIVGVGSLCATLFASTALALPTFSTFVARAGYQAALGGAPVLTQDFEALADNTNLFSVPFLPGVAATTNGETLIVFDSAAVSKVLFGSARAGKTEFFYDINFTSPYNAVGFDISAFDPRAQTGALDVFFADSTNTQFLIGPGASETTPVFFGIIADTSITRIRWSEPADPISGVCCEETALDNFAIANTIPEPGVLALVTAALIALSANRRRQRCIHRLA